MARPQVRTAPGKDSSRCPPLPAIMGSVLHHGMLLQEHPGTIIRINQFLQLSPSSLETDFWESGAAVRCDTMS